jgi:ribokinase
MHQKPNILVIGSANMDMVIQSDHFPSPGETIIGGEFSLIPGGKGANQAVAAARLGGEVSFISQLGKDLFGQQNLSNYQQEGINTSHILLNPNKPSGVALITVDKSGENTIIVAPGANEALSIRDIHNAINLFEIADIILIQLEIQMPVVCEACRMAFDMGKQIILNPAPATLIPEATYPHLFMITPNETETEIMTGLKVSNLQSAREACLKLQEKGVPNVIITMGAAGAYVHTSEFQGIIPTEKVEVKDTTAAGDTFNGALAVALAKKQGIQEAVKFALKAATLSVQRFGAQTSIPFSTELA